MDWSMNINKAENGYICEWWEETEEGHHEKRQWVIEERNSDDGELEAMMDLLYVIMDHFGVYYSKHKKKNLYLEIREHEQEQVVDSIE